MIDLDYVTNQGPREHNEPREVNPDEKNGDNRQGAIDHLVGWEVMNILHKPPLRHLK